MPLEVSKSVLECESSYEDDMLPFRMEYIPDYIRQKAEEELKETVESRTRCLQELKHKISADKNLCSVKFEDDFLLQFLRHGKFKVDKALDRIRNYHSILRKRPELLEPVPEKRIACKAADFFTLMPRRCPDGCLVAVVHIGLWDPTQLPLEELYQLLLLCVLQLSRDPVTQISGFKLIYDFKDTLRLIRYCTPKDLYLLYNIGVRSLPCRWREIHVYNENLTTRVMWAFLTKFLSAKMQKRVHMHSDMKKLHSFFPKGLLHCEFGAVDQEPTRNWVKKANQDQEQMRIGGQANYY